jgi:hypothetical protein
MIVMMRTLLIAAALLFVAPVSAAQSAEIPSALSIAKSSNKNQVHYAVQVDDACVPAGAAPVRAYWRMLEKSADATEPLARHEERAFGIERQDVDRDAVRITLRGLPGRVITIHTERGASGACAAMASTTIGGVAARISSVFVKIKLFGVDYVQLTGTTNDGSVVKERLSL